MDRHPRDDVPGGIRGGHQLAAHGLGKRPDGRRGELRQHSGHQPVEAVGRDAGEYGEGNVDGHSVRVGAGLKLVGERQRELALGPRVRELGRVHLGRVGHEQLGRVGEQVRVLPAGALPPLVEMRGGDHVVGEALVVEVE